MTKPAQPTKPIRCAIYTRKSSEEGLEQDFNSLHAQRAACSAYILSQVGENWAESPTLYDDGGYSGGSMERPALQRLLADIRAARVDVVVVYKVDRLTRALGDFARIVEVFDQAGVSFVSVTQAFNTTTSMGRLTLNVLLSFAQFEREVTGERIRDKIAASKQKGMWMGGTPALGYDPAGRTLTVNPGETETVRMIFRRYLEIGSVYRLREALEREGVVSKVCVAKSGRVRGGVPFNRGALFHLLRNRLYLGEIPHKQQSYPGQHPAIVDLETFAKVQAMLDGAAARSNSAPDQLSPRLAAMPLIGRIFDRQDKAMSPVRANRKGGAAYRYYVSTSLQVGSGEGERLPAGAVEAVVVDRLRRLGLIAKSSDLPDWGLVRSVLLKVSRGEEQLSLLVSRDAVQALGDLSALQGRLPDGDRVWACEAGVVLAVPFRLKRGLAMVAVGPHGRPAVETLRIDKPLHAGLVRAEAWKRRLLAGEVADIETLAREECVAASYAARLMRLAFLAPDLKRAILDGRQPPAMSLQAIMTRSLPLSWSDQRRALNE